MELLRSGGTNASLEKEDSGYDTYGFGNYFMLRIKPALQQLLRRGEEVAVCTAAKPNKHHYDSRFEDMGFDIGDFTVLGRGDEPDWGTYAAVLMLGGETKELHAWLSETGFSLDSLTNCHILAGDSAGAYVLSGKTLVEYAPDGTSFETTDGFLPSLNQLVAGHANNTHYHEPGLSEALGSWCETNGVEYVALEENELYRIRI